MLFLLWFCSPLPRRGLLVRVGFRVKGRVCRSPFYIKFLTSHPSLFAIVTHSPNFMILLTPPKMLENILYQSQSHVCYHFRIPSCFAFLSEWRFAQKRILGFYCLHLPDIVLSYSKQQKMCLPLSREWSYQQEYLWNVFQWNQESKDPNHTAVLKGRDIAEFIQKKKAVFKITASLNQLALFSYLFTLIILFGLFLYERYACLRVWEGFTISHSVL